MKEVYKILMGAAATAGAAMYIASKISSSKNDELIFDESPSLSRDEEENAKKNTDPDTTEKYHVYRDEIIRLAMSNVGTMSTLDIVSVTDQIIFLLGNVDLSDGERLWVKHDIVEYAERVRDRLDDIRNYNIESLMNIYHVQCRMVTLMDALEAW